MLKKVFLTTAAFLLYANTAYAIDVPEYRGYVNDFANIISDGAESEISSMITAFETETSHEIAVATVSSLQEVTIEEYAETLFQKWGIGKEKNDNGVLLLVASNEREVRIEVGYGLEGVLTDAISSNIINEIIVPDFQNEDFDGGIKDAVFAIMQTAKGEVVDFPEKSEQTKEDEIPGIIILIFFLIYGFIWVPGIVMRKIQTMKPKILVRSLIGGFGILVTLGISIFAAIAAAFILFGGGILFDSLAHKYRNTDKSALPWWLRFRGGRSGRGGFFGGGGGGFGGGGFGGFSGGSSGGGGSSGRW